MNKKIQFEWIAQRLNKWRKNIQETIPYANSTTKRKCWKQKKTNWSIYCYKQNLIWDGMKNDDRVQHCKKFRIRHFDGSTVIPCIIAVRFISSSYCSPSVALEYDWSSSVNGGHCSIYTAHTHWALSDRSVIIYSYRRFIEAYTWKEKRTQQIYTYIVHVFFFFLFNDRKEKTKFLWHKSSCLTVARATRPKHVHK